MRYALLLLSSLLMQIPLHSLRLSDYVAQAVGEEETSDDIKNKTLFLVKSLQVNNHKDAKLAYNFLLKSKYFNKNKEALDKALSELPMAGSMTADKYKGHQGPQAIDDMIEMFHNGPGSAVYKKLASTEAQAKEAIEKVTTALEETKSLLS